MRRLILSGLVWALLGVAQARADSGAALVTDVVGAGKPPVRTLDSLSPGAQLKLERGFQVTLMFYGDGHKEVLSGPCQATITAAGSHLTAGQASACKADKPVGAALLAPSGNLQRLGGFVSRGIHSFHLKLAHALVDPPRFSWTTDLAGPYQVSVLGPPDYEPIWSKQTSASELLYDGPPLKPDTRYKWEVQAVSSEDMDAPQGKFVILSGADREAVKKARAEAASLAASEPQDPTPHVLLMVFLADRYMLEDALVEGRKALELRQDDGSLHQALSRILLEMGDIVEAGRERARAEALGVAN